MVQTIGWAAKIALSSWPWLHRQAIEAHERDTRGTSRDLGWHNEGTSPHGAVRMTTLLG